MLLPELLVNSSCISLRSQVHEHAFVIEDKNSVRALQIVPTAFDWSCLIVMGTFGDADLKFNGILSLLTMSPLHSFHHTIIIIHVLVPNKIWARERGKSTLRHIKRRNIIMKTITTIYLPQNVRKNNWKRQEVDNDTDRRTNIVLCYLPVTTSWFSLQPML